MLHFDEIVFGPIRSRRLGSSLGVNVLPTKGKLCNFDCIYCECGWNKDGMSDKKFPRLADVKEALQKKLEALSQEGAEVDSITFSGNGEPTLNPDFAAIVDTTVSLRDRFYPSAKISVLSNATMLGREDVFDALRKVDNPILKIDASSDELIATVDSEGCVTAKAEGTCVITITCGNVKVEYNVICLFPGVEIFPGWEPTEAPPTEPPKEWKVTSNYVNIRSGPAKDYDRVRQVHKGDLVYVYEEKDVKGTPWGRLEDGWICLTYAKLVE